MNTHTIDAQDIEHEHTDPRDKLLWCALDILRPWARDRNEERLALVLSLEKYFGLAEEASRERTSPYAVDDSPYQHAPR